MIRNTSTFTQGFKNRLVRLVTVCWAVVALCSDTRAQEFFDFVEDGTDKILATIEFSALPATSSSQIASFSFTADGDALFGFGVGLYPGTFEEFQGVGVVDVFAGELKSDSPILSTIIPSSDTPTAGTTLELTVAGRGGVPADASSMSFSDLAAPTNNFEVEGRFLQVVPEPTAFGLSSLAILLGTGMERRRRRPVQ